MPWKMSDAPKKTKKANNPAKKKAWAGTANSVLKKSGDEGKAIRIANAAIAKKKAGKGHGPGRGDGTGPAKGLKPKRKSTKSNQRKPSFG